MSNYRIFLLLVFVYFVIHTTNLTLLPIFNDEAIYIDWGWLQIHWPGHLYDSLYDAKQPLMIWIFGIVGNFFTDPLFSGRFTSVIVGAITMLGIYVTGKKLFNRHIGLLSAYIFAIIPIFVFYNRQALMEAAIACVGIWSFNALLNLLQKPTTRNGIILGIILGFGFFIKSSSLLFIVSSTVIILFFILKKRKGELLKPYFISLISFFCVNFLLFINPVFWQTFSTNSRYSYSLAELFAFPIGPWMNHLLGFFEIGLVFFTPLLFVCGIVGIVIMKKENIKNSKIFLIYFILALLLEIFSGKTQSQRYVVSFLPFLAIPSAYIIHILWKGNILKKTTVIIAFCIPLILSLALIFFPELYIMKLSKISSYSDVPHVRGQTSGYGINEAMLYIKEMASSRLTMIFFGLNAGNPEDAVNVYAMKTTNLFTFHIDSKILPEVNQYDCLFSQYPVFFVTRRNELLGLERYFVLEKSFVNPDNVYSIGIYTLKKDCKGKTASLSDSYKKALNTELYLKGIIKFPY